ncbi:MAG: hypothetical protein ABEJ30_03295 [Halorientalis sp.]
MDDETAGDVDRKRLVKVLLVLAIAVPLLIEGMTFAGLFQAKVFDGGGPGNETATGTPDRPRVGVGDTVLAATPQTERVTDATIRARDGTWVFRLEFAINNTANSDYRFRVGEVTTTGGETASGTGSAVVPAGESATVTGEWRLPEGTQPDTVVLVGVQLDDGTRVSERVRVARVPVRYD